MTKYSHYYEQVLYPIQNEVLKNLKSLNLPFYLTGGTAVSRGYLNHRYSDDLDLFTTSDKDFLLYIDSIIKLLEKQGYTIDFADSNSDCFTRIYVNRNKNGLNKSGLKIDFVADIVPHFGNIIETPVYYRTDSLRNILSNKYTALYRLSVKDVADIHGIASKYDFNWKDIIQEADEKEGGIDYKEISAIFSSYTENDLKKIKWTTLKTDEEIFTMKKEINIIAQDIILQQNNRLLDIRINNAIKNTEEKKGNLFSINKNEKHNNIER